MNYKLFTKFVLRTPLFSYQFILSIMEDENGFEKAWSNPIVQDAIYLASPLLYNELKKYFNGKIADKREINRLLYSFFRYLSRMSTRCTPFGLFSGCTVGEIDKCTDIEMDGSFERNTRLDMYYLMMLYDALIKIPEIKNYIKYYPNTSLYPLKKTYRYIDSKSNNSIIKYQISEVENSVYLSRVFLLAKTGITRQKLIDVLNCKYKISVDEVESFVDLLIDSGLLIGELSQSVTGDDYLDRLIKLIKSMNLSIDILAPLIRIKKLLMKMDLYSGNIEIYEEVKLIINKLGVSYNDKSLFQVDMLKNASKALLGENITKEIFSTMLFLNKITPALSKEPLGLFQQAFYKRYEDREIPLMEALDPECGIGYSLKHEGSDLSPLIDDFFLPAQQKLPANKQSLFHTILIRKTIDCLSLKGKEIVLTDDDVKDFPVKWDDLPTTMSTMFEIICATPEQTQIKLNQFGGVSGANLLARFAHTDERMACLIKEITQKEQDVMSEAILGEIVHLPEARVGNILSRPHIRPYELLFMSHSDLCQDKLLDVSDLMLSVRKGQLILRSKKFNKQLIPRLTTAHNYVNNTLPAYRFLCDMQHPVGRTALFFGWTPEMEELFPFRPRVRYKNTILSPASWTIKREEMDHLFIIKDKKILLNEIKEWRKKCSLPRYVLMADGDNKLFVDWGNFLSVQSLFSIINKRKSIVFVESVFEEKSAVVKNKGMSFFNECIVVLFKNTNI